jgi:hypothetical protein
MEILNNGVRQEAVPPSVPHHFLPLLLFLPDEFLFSWKPNLDALLQFAHCSGGHFSGWNYIIK